MAFLLYSERNRIDEGRLPPIPRESVDHVLVSAGYVKRLAIRTEGETEENSGQRNFLQHRPAISVDNLDALFSPAVEEHYQPASVRRHGHCQRHCAELIGAAGGIERRAFSPDGQSLYVSGGNQDVIYRFAWNGREATLVGRLRSL